jgi:hypothetical protein
VAREVDLSLKKMAEKPKDYVLQNAQRYRQLAGQSKLRLYIEQTCEKYGCKPQDRKEAYGMFPCSECGAKIEKGVKLFLTCENGHKQDRDVGESRFLLNTIAGVAGISAGPIEIPVNLRRYLCPMTASEVGIELVER